MFIVCLSAAADNSLHSGPMSSLCSANEPTQKIITIVRGVVS